MVGLVVAINLANKRLFNGISGWRVVYFAAAVLGLLTALIAALFISEPRHGQRVAGQDPGVGSSTNLAADPGRCACAARPRASCGAAAGFGREFSGHMWAVAKTPSFLVILVVSQSINYRARCLSHLRLKSVAHPSCNVGLSPPFLQEHISSLTRGASGYQVLYLQACRTRGIALFLLGVLARVHTICGCGVCARASLLEKGAKPGTLTACSVLRVAPRTSAGSA